VKGLEAFAREAFPPARKVSLQSLTTWRIGGDAMCLDIGSAQAASDAIGRLDAEGIDWFVLGRGSNILAADGGYAGMLLAPGAGLAGGAWSLEDGMHRALAGCAAPHGASKTACTGLSRAAQPGFPRWPARPALEAQAGCCSPRAFPARWEEPSA